MRIISGAFRGRTIRSISGPGYRPATGKVRQALFSMLDSRGVPWTEFRILDLFAGSGSLGLEALSRGAREAWFVEKNKKAARVIGENNRELGVASDRYKVFSKDVLDFLRMGGQGTFDLAFVDPPYGKGLIAPVLHEIPPLLGPDGYVVAEVESGLDFGPEDFPGLDLLINRKYGQTRIGIWIAIDKK
ncbi:MAG: 16S rRNA (guanine(966)-N(2))-methyltransferase RsmD [Desulfohalobiaceae bacterium]|nr:16S rRNA (guanine(966)-N(2))-methyltransferase RsmD [Desulfohalobiaceae bacterium]